MKRGKDRIQTSNSKKLVIGNDEMTILSNRRMSKLAISPTKPDKKPIHYCYRSVLTRNTKKFDTHTKTAASTFDWFFFGKVQPTHASFSVITINTLNFFECRQTQQYQKQASQPAWNVKKESESRKGSSEEIPTISVITLSIQSQW